MTCQFQCQLLFTCSLWSGLLLSNFAETAFTRLHCTLNRKINSVFSGGICSLVWPTNFTKIRSTCHHAKHLYQMSFRLKDIVLNYKHTHTHGGPTALPRLQNVGNKKLLSLMFNVLQCGRLSWLSVALNMWQMWQMPRASGLTGPPEVETNFFSPPVVK